MTERKAADIKEVGPSAYQITRNGKIWKTLLPKPNSEQRLRNILYQCPQLIGGTYVYRS